MELVCPAGNLPALKIAIDNGADTVYIGFGDDTNARHFAGLNFNEDRAKQGVEYAHTRGKKIYVAINTYPQPSGWQRWIDAVDRAAKIGVDAIILADIGLMEYAHNKHPNLNLHLSVQGSATSYEALDFYYQNFNIKRAVLPRVLSIAQVKKVIEHSPVEIEVFGFGSLCVMVEGRCILSSYATGRSPNTYGACSPASHVEYVENDIQLETRLGGVLIDSYDKYEVAGYPTLCKGRFEAMGNTYYALEEPTSLNTLDILPELKEIGVKAIKIEGRQRSPAYIKTVAKTWSEALKQLDKGEYQTKNEWNLALSEVSEGFQTTLGAYHRSWQ
ncbi:MAG: U32 family peptidase [Candidatus Ruthia sp.]|nr:U32 family peptidase [Candidatus Ruthturnera sp.]MBT4122337.1 U32 family peptidase [Candidatus Ruthturnera sp.]MBT4668509.1 U32 family peptidase [Candidatus Ruthturnera sp.]MBT6922897.1 U32 family peptidase [Candidatus Ruthturnera sp.]